MIQCGIYIHLEMLIGDIQQSCLFRNLLIGVLLLLAPDGGKEELA